MNMDLWATLDNHQENQEQAPVAREPTRAQGQQIQKRRLTEGVVHAVVREWLLRDCAAAYCRSLASIRIFRRCYWIDGLGMDARTRAEIMEPVVELGRVLAGESKPIALRGLVLKAGSSRRRDVREAVGKVAAVKLPEESGVVDGSWLEGASAILQAIEQAPAMFLLNPFGQTLFTYDDLAPLYQRTGPTELFLLLSHRQLASHLLAAAETGSAEASTLLALLRSDRWKSLLASMKSADKNSTSIDQGKGVVDLLQQGQLEASPTIMSAPTSLPAQAIDGLIDLFVASMKARFLTVQRIVLPVQVGPAAVEQAPYTLLFATRRQDSLAIMNDAVCAYRRRVSMQSYQGVLGEEWFAQQERERLAVEQRELEQLVATAGTTQRPRRWPELRQYLLIVHFGRWPVEEYDAVLCQLLKNGMVRCEWRRKATSSTTNGTNVKQVPGDEDILLWK